MTRGVVEGGQSPTGENVILLLLLGGEWRMRPPAAGPVWGVARAVVGGSRHCVLCWFFFEVVEKKREGRDEVGVMMLLLISGERLAGESVGWGERSWLGWCLLHKGGGLLHPLSLTCHVMVPARWMDVGAYNQKQQQAPPKLQRYQGSIPHSLLSSVRAIDIKGPDILPCAFARVKRTKQPPT